MTELVKVNEIKITTGTSTNIINANIVANTKLPVMRATSLHDWRNKIPFAIVGGGASLKQTVNELKDYRYVMVCGSAHDYLVQNNVYPDYCVICDPDKLVLEYIKYPVRRCTYLVASQCDPKVFEYLQYNSCKVVIWHCAGNDEENKVFADGEILVGGGCTVGTRAISLAINFGFNTFDLYGFDTCVTEDGSHAYDFSNPEVEQLKDVIEVDLAGTKFKMAGYMMGQFFDFQKLILGYGAHCSFNIHGPGALYHLMQLSNTIVKDNDNGTAR